MGCLAVHPAIWSLNAETLYRPCGYTPLLSAVDHHKATALWDRCTVPLLGMILLGC